MQVLIPNLKDPRVRTRHAYVFLHARFESGAGVAPSRELGEAERDALDDGRPAELGDNLRRDRLGLLAGRERLRLTLEQALQDFDACFNTASDAMSCLGAPILQMVAQLRAMTTDDTDALTALLVRGRDLSADDSANLEQSVVDRTRLGPHARPRVPHSISRYSLLQVRARGRSCRAA